MPPHTHAPVLGLDIGGTKLAAGVVTATGTIQGYGRIPTGRNDGPDAVIKRLFDLGQSALASAGLTASDISAVGIGCGGPLDPVTGIIECPPGLPDWDGVPLGDLAGERFGCPAFIDNDAAAAALGEFRYGGWTDSRVFCYLTVSTGIGGGIIIDGHPFRGATGNGGEIGHTIVDWTGRPCNCGQRGCAEAYVSGTAIGKRATERVNAGEQSCLASLEVITAHDVERAARAGDRLARDIWQESMAILGRVLGGVVNVLEPDLIVLGGGVTRAGAMFLEPVRQATLAGIMAPGRVNPRIELAVLGDHVGVVGAGAIARQRLSIDNQ